MIKKPHLFVITF